MVRQNRDRPQLGWLDKRERRNDRIALAVLVMVSITWTLVMAHLVIQWFGKYS